VVDKYRANKVAAAGAQAQMPRTHCCSERHKAQKDRKRRKNTNWRCENDSKTIPQRVFPHIAERAPAKRSVKTKTERHDYKSDNNERRLYASKESKGNAIKWSNSTRKLEDALGILRLRQQKGWRLEQNPTASFWCPTTGPRETFDFVLKAFCCTTRISWDEEHALKTADTRILLCAAPPQQTPMPSVRAFRGCVNIMRHHHARSLEGIRMKAKTKKK